MANLMKVAMRIETETEAADVAVEAMVVDMTAIMNTKIATMNVEEEADMVEVAEVEIVTEKEVNIEYVE